MNLTIVSVAYALWLAAINVVFYLTHGHDFGAQEYSVLAGIVPMALQLLLLGFDPRGMAGPARVMATLLLVILMSYLFNGADWTAVTYVVEVVYIAAVTTLVAGCPDRRLLARVAACYSVPTALFLLYIDWRGEYLWGRLVAGNLESNAWGLMGLSVAVTAFGHRSRLAAGFCIAAGCATIYAASSRSSMVGLALAVAIIVVRSVVMLRDRRLAAALAVGAGALVLAVLFIPAAKDVTLSFLDDLFKLDDPLRGLGKGATGRDQLWEAALDLWWQHPFFGVGFRMHEAFLPLNYSAHNAYLAMLADTGIFGFLWYVALMGRAFVGMFRLGDAPTRALAIAIVVSYAIVGLFERRAINGANPMSLFFLMAALFILREQALARARRVAWRQTEAAVARAGV